MKNPSLMPQIAELHQKILECMGMAIQQKIDALRVTYYIFDTNYRELKDSLKEYAQPDSSLALMEEKNRAQLEQFCAELTRRLHNFLAGAKSLVDHTRNMVKELYKEHSFLDEYQNKIGDTFAASGVAVFIQELRNYTLHYKLPVAAISMDMTKLDAGTWEISNGISLSKESLKEFSGFTKLAKDYLENSPDQIALAPIVDQYFSLVTTFYGWLGERQQEVHKAEFGEMNALQTLLKGLMDQAGIPLVPIEEV